MRENSAVSERLGKRVGLVQLWAEGEEISRLTASGMAIQALKMAFASMRASVFTASMTLLTMFFSLFVFAAFLLFVENVNRSLVGTQNEISMSVYLRDSASEEDRKELEDFLDRAGIVRTKNFIDKAQAFEAFRGAVGADSPLIEGIEGSNPLPASYELTFRSVDDLEKQIESLAESVRQRPTVEHVDYSRGMMSVILSALRAVQYVGSFAIFAMLFLSGFIMTVAIRLALYAHRDEIEIMYLVGATRTFIRAPYMIEGLAQGVVGSLCSMFVLYLVFYPLRGSISGPVASLFIGEPRFLSFGSTVLVFALGIFVGIVGSYAAVRQVSTVTIGEER